MSDSVRCGAVACLLLGAADVIALAHGGRDAVPAGALWVMVAGLVLPILNVWFVGKDLVRRRPKSAAAGAALSAWALFQAFSPAWIAFLHR